MNKIFVIVICLFILVSLVACKPDSQENDENNTTEEITEHEPTEAELALEMYQAAVKGKIRVHSDYQGEIELKDCLLPGLFKRLEESIVNEKAIVDLDGDGISEYVIESSLGDSVVLHYFEGKVYAYVFSFRSFYSLHTDGSFNWNQTRDGVLTYGAAKIRFEGAKLIEETLYMIIEAEDSDSVYYIGDKEVTEQELSAYLEQTCKTFVEYSDFEAPWKKTISEERALEIAADYWNFNDGDVDSDSGYPLALIPKYCESGNYLIALSCLVEDHHYSTIEMIEIDAFTGKIIILD